MAFKVGVGKSNFAAIRESNDYYVDKTDILYELIEETDNEVTLFTRPRRFGKTLMLSMMTNFFSIRKDSRDLFEGLKITEHKEFCEKWMNQIPVLFVSFKDIEGETFEGAYKMLKTRIADICKEFDDLSENGGSIVQAISDELTYDTLHASEGNLWSVILMTGYLTKANAEEEEETVSLKIPNREIATIFEDTVAKWFRDTLDDSAQKSMMETLWSGDEDAASKAISDLLWKTISYHDYHEDYYHAFLTGLFVGRGYEVYSNKDTAGVPWQKGLGRPDIQLLDRNNRRAIIIEAKKSKRESDLDQDCKAAIDQIVTQKYAEGLYGYTQILCYGIAFYQKQAKVKIL